MKVDKTSSLSFKNEGQQIECLKLTAISTSVFSNASSKVSQKSAKDVHHVLMAESDVCMAD
jgi:predicted kinase